MKWKPKHSSLAIIALGFSLFYFWFHKDWMLVPVGMVFIGFLIGSVGDWMHLSWMLLAKLLGWINSRILLSVLFFLILTPLAVLARILKKTTIRLKAEKTESFFTERNHVYVKEDLSQPW